MAQELGNLLKNQRSGLPKSRVVSKKSDSQSLRVKKKVSLTNSNLQRNAAKRNIVKTKRVKSKSKISKKYFNLILIIPFLLFTISFITFSKHRQLCAYQNAVESGAIDSTSDNNICRNILNPGNWIKSLFDIFNFSYKKNLSENLEYTVTKLNLVDSACDAGSLSPVCWLKELEGELAQKDGFTNFLLVGTDSRDSSELYGNTDTILVLSYDHTNNEVLLISFPRDLLIFNESIYGGTEYIRINSIYPWYGEKGTEAIVSSIEQVIGKEIQYHVLFSFDTFTKIIDSLGGITITLEEPFEDAFPKDEVLDNGYLCENEASFDSNFCIINFPAGTQRFSSFDALMYSRARYLSSDFARARRQQEIIKAIISNVLDSDDRSLPELFELATNLYSDLNSTVDTNIQVKDISGMFKLLDSFTGNVATIVADPYLEDFSIIYDAGVVEGFGYVLKFYDYTYADFQNAINKTWDLLPFYVDRPNIRVINASGVDLETQDSLNDFLEQDNPYVDIKFEEGDFDFQGIRIYDMTVDKKMSASTKAIQERVIGSFIYDPTIDGILNSGFEDIVIVIGK